MYILLSTLNHVSIALAAGSAFITDLFFILSLKNHRIKGYEVNILSRLNLSSLFGSMIALITSLLILAIEIDAGFFDNEGVTYAKIILLILIFLTTLGIRRLHLPTLVRHQQDYHHLSDSFVVHTDAIVGASAFSTVTWVFVLMLAAYQKGAEGVIFIGFTGFMIVYIIAVFIASQLSIFLKRFLKSKTYSKS